MDLRLTPEDQAFRQEVREWMKAELPPDWDSMERLIDFEEPEWVGFAQDFRKKLADKGWLVMHW
ncbi:MAG: acyl-CoA dehydrogenase family protein, partial [Dehalococcoidia bacterium]|nr:acyl-CoA dehydrogenase family protein [Dehalococcoidia bacterium]